MAESKNTFLQGKMNKDLDERIIPNGEYRDAINIAVGKSEGGNVGSLQNILGNEKLTKPSGTGTVPFETNEELVCIGYFVDNDNNRVFQFLTDYIDPNPSLITIPEPLAGFTMKITVYDPQSTGTPYLTLAEGLFLNLSTTNLITGVNLIEDLLFWTDNRNQPRKINVNSAITNSVESGNPYYTTVDQISVAKYAPFTAPELYYITQGVNLTSKLGASTSVAGQTKIYVLTSAIAEYGLTIGAQLINTDLSPAITASDSAIVTNIINEGTYSSVYISLGSDFSIPENTLLVFFNTSMTNESDNEDFAGDTNFLRDKFVRFSYRFKFDDNEYSLMAPFTQPIFIPKQKGFFIEDNEDAAYRSTIVEWMENEINSATLFIELPDVGSDIRTSYKIKSIDILYKESDALSVKVVETISISKIQQASPNTNIYAYTYNSQKPYKTLQPTETARVYDKVPVRALAQEVAGNRVIYGNFVNQSTPPSLLDYNIAVLEKDETYTSWIEYPNHTLKQNRTYQVGIVLADKFGRQSSVILSNNVSTTGLSTIAYGASSLYLPYKELNNGLDVIDWLGYSLSVIFNNPITSNRDEITGTPGLYATVSGAIEGSSDGFEINNFSGSNGNYIFTLVGGGAPENIPAEGKYLRGKYKDYVKVLYVDMPSPPPAINIDLVVQTDGEINDIYKYDSENPYDIKYSYSLNELGWYSYKVVVKQQEQDYYNVYVPGMLAGYPVNQTATLGNPTMFPANEDQVTSHFVSINDNINKVPRDLTEVGPNQKQYRSSAKLWTRVENVLIPEDSYTTNRQYYPIQIPDTVNTIAPSTDLGFLPTIVGTTSTTNEPSNPYGSAAYNLYQFETSPLVCRVSTNFKTGVVGNTQVGLISPSASNAMSPFLGIYETAPDISLLDIFWETSTTGLISDLNADILTGSNGATGYSALGWEFKENQDPLGNGETTGAINSPYVTDWFVFQNAAGIEIENITNWVFSARTISGTSMAGGDPLDDKFELIRNTDNSSPNYLSYRIKIKTKELYYGIDYATNGSYIFTFEITHTVDGVVYNSTIDTSREILRISNVAPEVTFPANDEGPIYQLTSDPYIGEVADLSGRNGNNSTLETSFLPDLYWSYNPLPGNPVEWADWFGVNSANGNISITPFADFSIFREIYPIGIKLQDATNPTGAAVSGSLETERIVNLQVPDLRGAQCSDWTSSVTQGQFQESYVVRAQGNINIWKMLRKNEIVLSSDLLKIYSWGQIGEINTIYLNISAADNVITFASGGPNGTFNLTLANGAATDKAARKLSIRGRVSVGVPGQTNRELNIDSIFTYTAEGFRSSRCETCLIGPTPYISQFCKVWAINNTSVFPIPFNGLHGNTRGVVGGIIPPGAWVGSTLGLSQFAPPGAWTVYPTIRGNSLSAATNGVTGGVIYYGGNTVCPT